MSGLEAVIGQGTPMQIAWWQMCIRALIIFIYGVALLRIAGMRAFGRQSALDIILTVLIGSNLSRALTGGAPFLPTLAATAVMTLLYFLSIHLAQRSDVAGWIMKGAPVVLVHLGKRQDKNMSQTGISHADLEEAARTAGARSMDEVEHATLERSGHISIVKRKD